jgi:predicted esterase
MFGQRIVAIPGTRPVRFTVLSALSAFLAILLVPRVALGVDSTATAAPPSAPAQAPVAAPPTPADLAKKRLAMIRAQPLGAEFAIFDGAVFPAIDFANKGLVQAAIGPYTLGIRFFDAQWNEVTVPQAPGRYGALVEFRSADGLTFTAQRTLFKTAQPYLPDHPKVEPYGVTVKFPAAFGLPETIGATESWNINDGMGLVVENQSTREGRQAVVAAALQDIATDPVKWSGFDVQRIEGAWWSELYKRLGENQDYPYLTYMPDGYDKDQHPWPLLLFLHGWNGREPNLKSGQNYGPLGYVHKTHPLPLIIVAPACPLNPAGAQDWDCARLLHLLDELAQTYRIDPKRIYVTGLSMGGFATIDLAAMYPDRIAAIVPLSAGENPGLAPRLKNMPAWFFHGADDHSVPPRYASDLVDAMQKLGAPVKLTIYPGLGHSSATWSKAYNDPDLYTWLLQQSK